MFNRRGYLHRAAAALANVICVHCSVTAAFAQPPVAPAVRRSCAYDTLVIVQVTSEPSNNTVAR